MSKEPVKSCLDCFDVVIAPLIVPVVCVGWCGEVSRDEASFLLRKRGKQKGLDVMILQGMVLSGQVLESVFYDQMTGQAKPGLSVQLTVLDGETDEKYQCQVTEGFAMLEHLKDLRRQGQPIDLPQAKAQLEAELPPKHAPITLLVWGIKGKGGFHTLKCRFAQVAATI